MNNFDFYNPVRVHFGSGKVNDVGKLAQSAGRRVCIISYRELGFLKPLCDRVEGMLKSEGLAAFTFYEAEPNPDIATITEGAEFCRDRNIDLIIGIGGGSAMDAAKAIAAGVFYEGGGSLEYGFTADMIIFRP